MSGPDERLSSDEHIAPDAAEIDAAVPPAPPVAAPAVPLASPVTAATPIAPFPAVALSESAAEPRRRRTALVAGVVAAVVAAAVLAVLLLGGGDDDPDAGPASTAPPTTAPATTEAIGKTASPGGSGAASGAVDLPGAVTFAGLAFTVESLDVERGGAGARSEIVLRATVRNTYAETVVYTTPLVVELDVAGSTLPASPGGGVSYLEDGREAEAEYRFVLPESVADPPDLAGAVLRLSNTGDEPLVVPMDGAAVAGPAVASFDPPAEVAVDPLGLVFAFDAGSVSRDMPLELTGNIDTTALRAAEGAGFVRFHGTVTGRCTTGCPGGVLASSGVARLVVDGSPTPPTTLTFNEVLADGQRVDIDLVFEVPLGAGTYVLRFDGGSLGVVDTPIELPALPT
jgi:hypothetical protein